MLRESGCIKLPARRTLQDYTHYVQASTGFSSEVGSDVIHSTNQVQSRTSGCHLTLHANSSEMLLFNWWFQKSCLGANLPGQRACAPCLVWAMPSGNASTDQLVDVQS